MSRTLDVLTVIMKRDNKQVYKINVDANLSHKEARKSIINMYYWNKANHQEIDVKGWYNQYQYEFINETINI